MSGRLAELVAKVTPEVRANMERQYVEKILKREMLNAEIILLETALNLAQEIEVESER